MGKMRLVSEGAEAKIYATTLLGKEAIVKRRVPKSYRAKALDEMLRSRRTKVEARALTQAADAGVQVPALLLVDDYDIYMSNVKGKNLNAVLDESETRHVQKLLESVGRHLGLMHAAGMAHGDYTPANIMVCGDATYVIDFGLASNAGSVEEQALDLLLMKRSLSKSDFGAFVAGYIKEFKDNVKTIGRLNAIERRGRYQTRTMEAN